MRLFKASCALAAVWVIVQVLIVTAKSNLAHQARMDPLSVMPGTAKTAGTQRQKYPYIAYEYYTQEQLKKILDDRHWTVPRVDCAHQVKVCDGTAEIIGYVVGFGPSDDGLPPGTVTFLRM